MQDILIHSRVCLLLSEHIPVIDQGGFWREAQVCLRCIMDAILRVLYLVTVKKREEDIPGQ